MEVIYSQIRIRAKQVSAHFPIPDFYRDFSWANEMSRHVFDNDPVIKELHEYVAAHLEDDFGHGLEHATKVTLDAGALLAVEGRVAEYPEDDLNQWMRIVQSAGLLHDIRRKEKEHALRGAEFARSFLNVYPELIDSVEDICCAIANHEAFKRPVEIRNPRGALVSNCLYDADKFRWGPDNFTDTIWIMLAFSNRPLEAFVERYPRGVEAMKRIKSTFRTPTGKHYGPQFIDIGLAIGDAVIEVIKTEFI